VLGSNQFFDFSPEDRNARLVKQKRTKTTGHDLDPHRNHDDNHIDHDDSIDDHGPHIDHHDHHDRRWTPMAGSSNQNNSRDSLPRNRRRCHHGR